MNKELLTPTGAAILAHFVKPVDTFPQGRAIAIGYGAGDAELEGPNVLQGVLLEPDSHLIPDIIEVLETNADDVSGEVLGNLFEELLSMGARDVAIMPATMKKKEDLLILSRSLQSLKIAQNSPGRSLLRQGRLESGLCLPDTG